MNYYIALDVGGTFIKSAAVSAQGELLTEMWQDPAKSAESADEILSNFHDVVIRLMDLFPSDRLSGIGFAFPGPFDYGHGVSKMKGIGKYDAINGLSIEDELSSFADSFRFMEVPFTFLHDVESFALGLPSSLQQKTMCVCIGTGAGSAFLGKGNILRTPSENVPENGWIYNIPFKESIIDDYVSARGEDYLSEMIYGHVVEGRDLEKFAEHEDVRALQVFSLFGEDLVTALKPIIEHFQPEVVVFGGQISNSYHFFGRQIDQYAQSKGLKIVVMPKTSETILKGLAKEMNRGGTL